MTGELSQIIYDVVYDWCRAVLSPDAAGQDIPVIRSHQSKPAPADHYLVVSGEPELTEIGQPAIDETTESASPLENDYTGSLDLWEVGGHGDWLRRIAAWCRTMTAGEFFREHQFSVLSCGQVMPMPQVEGEQWVSEYRMPVYFALQVQTPNPVESMASVTTINNIPHMEEP